MLQLSRMYHAPILVWILASHLDCHVSVGIDGIELRRLTLHTCTLHRKPTVIPLNLLSVHALFRGFLDSLFIAARPWPHPCHLSAGLHKSLAAWSKGPGIKQHSVSQGL